MGYVRRKSLLAQVALSRASFLASGGMRPLSCGRQAAVRGSLHGAGSWRSALRASGSSVQMRVGRVFWVPLVSTVHRLFSFLCVSVF